MIGVSYDKYIELFQFSKKLENRNCYCNIQVYTWIVRIDNDVGLAHKLGVAAIATPFSLGNVI